MRVTRERATLDDELISTETAYYLTSLPAGLGSPSPTSTPTAPGSPSSASPTASCADYSSSALLTGALALAEPKTLRWRFWHTPARIIRRARRRIVRILDGWPATSALLEVYERIAQLA